MFGLLLFQGERSRETPHIAMLLTSLLTLFCFAISQFRHIFGYDNLNWNNLQDLAHIGFHWPNLSCQDLGCSKGELQDLLTAFPPVQLLFKHNVLHLLTLSQCVTLSLQLSGPLFILWKPPVFPNKVLCEVWYLWGWIIHICSLCAILREEVIGSSSDAKKGRGEYENPADWELWWHLL